MKYDKHYLLSAITITLIFLVSSMAYAQIPYSANYTIKKPILTNAGSQSSSDNYTISHILAQSSPVISSSSNGYRIYGGFRHSTKAVSYEADGDVAPIENHDGIVNVGDALVILRKALQIISF